MAIFSTFIQVVQIIAALIVIGLVLMQHGKGADMGAAFGSGASGSVFGATGSANFLSRATAIAAAVFFTTTLALAFAINQRSGFQSHSVIHTATEAVVPAETPVVVKPSVVKPSDTPAVPATAVSDTKVASPTPVSGVGSNLVKPATPMPAAHTAPAKPVVSVATPNPTIPSAPAAPVVKPVTVAPAASTVVAPKP